MAAAKRRRARSSRKDTGQIAAAVLARPFPAWPTWTCVAFDPDKGDVCDLAAEYQRPAPTPDGIPWPYCARHARREWPRIPAGTAYHTVRVDLRVALACPPVDEDRAVEDAVRRLANVVQGIGGLLVNLHVVGTRAVEPAAEGPPLRLELAGRPQPVPGRSALLGTPRELAPVRWRKERKTG